jgi:hypothetical protein
MPLFFSQEVPGFSVGAVEAGASGVVARGEEEAGAVVDDVDGEDEPGVLGNDVGDEEVDFVESIGNDTAVGAAVRIDVILAVEERGGGFDLDAPEAMSGFDNEVVALAVAVRLGHVETLAGGFVDERQFGKLSAALGGEFALAGSLWPLGAGSARAPTSFTLHESPNEKGTSGWLVPGFLLYASSIAYLIRVFRRAKEEYFRFGMRGLGEKRHSRGLDKKSGKRPRDWANPA